MRRVVPVDRVMALWAQGFSTSEIARKLGVIGGSTFRPQSIEHMILRQREMGDSRAHYRLTRRGRSTKD